MDQEESYRYIKMKVIKKIKEQWDWFETTKWLNILIGIVFASNLFMLFILFKSWSDWSLLMKISYIIVMICLEGVELCASYIVKILRERNNDSVNIKIN